LSCRDMENERKKIAEIRKEIEIFMAYAPSQAKINNMNTMSQVYMMPYKC